MTTVDPDPLELDESGLASIGRHWGLVLALGITSIIVGIIALVWPGKTIVVVAILLAAWLIVSGVFQVIRGQTIFGILGITIVLLIGGIMLLFVKAPERTSA